LPQIHRLKLAMTPSQKAGRYQRIYLQLQDLLKGQTNQIASMATVVALLHHKMKGFFWTGFYLLDAGELIVGPYQGSLACIKLKKDKGVCWAGINGGETVVVPDVHQFPGHIACDSRSNSEIVVPLHNASGQVIGVLDVDSTDFNNFDEVGTEWLKKIIGLIEIKN
jgi:L-methionine (R)-S-oxide reductase